MSQVFFISFLILVTLLRLPLAIIVVALRPLVPFIKKRLDFERINFLELSSLSFKKENGRADFCFEVSSEGELEQVSPLIETLLASDKKIEILFSSPSVEKKCIKIYERSPEKIRLLRLPLLSFWPFPFLYFQSIWFWLTAPVIVFCRYDFFPELLLMKFFGKKFVLVSGAFKKQSFYKSEAFKFFDIVIAATEVEKKNFDELLGEKSKTFSLDFRIPRIRERFDNSERTLEAHTTLKSYLEYLKKIPVKEKIILGSVWESDLCILEDKELKRHLLEKKMHLLFVPHKLDQESVDGLQRRLQQIFPNQDVEVLEDGKTYMGSSIVVLKMSGILCELYSLFETSYVGGGYERSIHSVLEPFFSGTFVIMGPKTHRSTEFDLLHELAPNEIHVLKNGESFYTHYKAMFLTNSPDQSMRMKWVQRTEAQRREVTSALIN